MKILVDTNIVIDALTGREPFRESAEQIFLLAANQIEDLYITASSAADIYYLARKHFHNTEQSKNILSKLYQLFAILDVNAVISCCAKRNQMNYIVTGNIKKYKDSRVKALLPDEFIKIISQNEE